MDSNWRSCLDLSSSTVLMRLWVCGSFMVYWNHQRRERERERENAWSISKSLAFCCHWRHSPWWQSDPWLSFVHYFLSFPELCCRFLPLSLFFLRSFLFALALLLWFMDWHIVNKPLFTRHPSKCSDYFLERKTPVLSACVKLFQWANQFDFTIFLFVWRSQNAIIANHSNINTLYCFGLIVGNYITHWLACPAHTPPAQRFVRIKAPTKHWKVENKLLEIFLLSLGDCCVVAKSQHYHHHHCRPPPCTKKKSINFHLSNKFYWDKFQISLSECYTFVITLAYSAHSTICQLSTKTHSPFNFFDRRLMSGFELLLFNINESVNQK